MSRGKIDHFRTALAQIGHVGTAVAETADRRLCQFRSAQADIMAHDDMPGLQERHKGAGQRIGQLGVDFRRHDTTDIVRLETFCANHMDLLLV